MEVCWFWDKFCPIDYAAWTQAIGSVIAIGVAPYLARSTERQREADNSKLLDIFTFEVISTLQLMLHLCDIENAPEFNRQKAKLQHAIDAAGRIDPGLLPYAAAVGVTVIQDSAAHVSALPPVAYGADFRLIKDRVQHEYDAASSAGKTIADTLRKRKWWKRNREAI